ncbi:hypothetical protein MANES_07G105102v8 [Manihot esculenta]|uniref:Uncharacterized protein n=1 Tax=Manihot esculenta TaxID=3983 RepID=A0ACB7HGY9_MANES|nr:hypothetical protein MANES_07G105102v8 [Manihot esculenta]
MLQTRIEARLESVERNLFLLKDGFSKLKTDNETIHSKLSSIESLLQTLLRSKYVVNEGEVSTQLTPNILTLSQPNTFIHSTLLSSPPLSKTLEIANFNGIDPIGWLTRAEQYFELNRSQLEFKVMMAMVCMVEGALHWLRWLQHRQPHLTWEQFSLELVNCYMLI